MGAIPVANRQTTLLIDTNVWLDCFLPGRPGQRDALNVVSTAIDLGIPLLYAVTSAKDVFYLVAAVLKREVRMQKGSFSEVDAACASSAAWACVENMRENATAVGADESDLWLACTYRGVHGDLEDNMVLAAARRSNATYLVTSDERLIRHAPVAALAPADAVEALKALG